ncbi:MAG: chlorite dismutase family protein [Actinomycetota bacterium]|jgi:chlorite dismutase|nr:chlorite dismutase family protein [Ilumatobacteraceae bacterium]MDA2959677.1 chlorite dismutase family protein [Actinomycetota bacterium]MDA3007478.1 chlorite dismutase family protein [Actinomycetota bacterium]MDA3034573.1 chlorite dismutase family protein [Actinomycetota bacterium]
MRMETGVCVLHLFCHVGPDVDVAAASTAVERATADGCQVVTASMLGHRCDLGVMAICADLTVLRRLQSALRAAGVCPTTSYLSITEVSEYAKGLPAEALADRLYPQLPPEGKPAFCFYPMSKAREAHANWYATPFDERTEMMMEHGRSGRNFAGRIVQLVTASTGLDSHEWGVTLFAVNLETIKDVVYTMRFDRGSALYGEFGDFYIGYLAPIGDALADALN